ncbi:YeeE/YedE thiosulfate transporter family protein [Aurantiacibacter sp. MUD11]|uniref:YeeE/YedE family protein n=1 Tax=Aurantiacibacter sp. MUD11 TaxID=3003265 RepID=UPI0022AA44AD|nr:YeeE/YedE thiosulfate transporter family protein [Aurantiacibacter sp. MUD11]WAT16694.1 YeeE/YedE thiosulfate transporter family protein [Aurantiacibacter sp. MUD11]
MTLPGFPDAAPLDGLFGGLLIGISAAIMLLGLGRIAGVSGIAAKAVGLGGSGMPRSSAWLFIIGLPLGALAIAMVNGGMDPSFAGPVPLIIAGLLVGFGTRIGSGCTSGHGVCGMSRLSGRSIVATLTFMAAGIATVAIMNAFNLEVLQ